MRRGEVHARITVLLACGLAVLVGLIKSVAFAEDLRITDFDVNAARNPTLEFPDDLDSYYILYQGGQITSIVLAVDMDLGTGSTGILSDSVAIGK